MFAPASKKVATGGPFGSKGNGAIDRSTGIPARPPPGGPAGAPPCRPRPSRGGPLLACIQSPEKSGFPSAVRGIGASPRTLPLESRGTFASVTVGHCAAIGTEPTVRTLHTRAKRMRVVIIFAPLPASLEFRTTRTRQHSHNLQSRGRYQVSDRQTLPHRLC